MSTVRAACVVYAPWISNCISSWPGSCTNPGFSAIALRELLQTLGLRVQFLEVKSYMDAYAMMRNGTADILCNPNYPEKGLMQQFGFTMPVAQDEPVFMIRDELSKNLESHLLFAICHWAVWLTFSCVLCAILSLRWAILAKYGSIFFIPFPSNKSFKILAASFFLALGVFLGIYSNFLAIGLSSPPRKAVPFRNLDELATKLLSKTCRMVIENNTRLESPRIQLFYPTISKHVGGALRKKLTSAYQIRPPSFVSRKTEMIRAIQQHPCYIGVSWGTEAPLIESFFCNVRFTTVPEANKVHFILYFRKNWEYGELFKKLLIQGSMDQLFLRLIDNGVKHSVHPECHGRSRGHKSLTVGQMYDLFLFWATAGLTGLLLVIGEKFHQLIHKRNSVEVDHSLEQL